MKTDKQQRKVLLFKDMPIDKKILLLRKAIAHMVWRGYE